MDDARSTDRRLWTIVTIVSLLSALGSLAVFVSHVPDFYVGDDFELIGDTLSGESPLAPVASHLRPMVRFHFLLYRLVDAAWFFGALSLLLHAAACVVLYLVFREIHGKRPALPIALLFFSSFLANETVFWISAAGVLYCAIFSGLSLHAFVRGRTLAATLWLFPAALSYELWMVVPLLFLFHFRRIRELIAPFVMVGVYLLLHLLVFGASGASSYGGFSFVDLPLRFSIYVFRFLSPLAGVPSPWITWLLAAGMLGLLAVPRYRFPAVIYAASALLFSLSAHVSSRFYYFPSLALVLIVVLALGSGRRPVRIGAACLAGYLALASPWINYLDGKDYGRKADLHRELYDALTQQFDRLAEGDTAVLINRLGPERLQSLLADLRGRPKLLFVRGPALGGMIYPEDAARMAFASRGLEPQPAECRGSTIELGRGRPLGRFCFRVASR